MSSGGTTPAYRASELVAFATALFRRAGLDPDKAGTVAEILVEGDLLGHTTHGLALAAPYLAALDAGSMTATAIPPSSLIAVAPCAGTAGDCPDPGSWSGRSSRRWRACPRSEPPRLRSARAITSAASPRISSVRPRRAA